jgi:hypothetical protein
MFEALTSGFDEDLTKFEQSTGFPQVFHRKGKGIAKRGQREGKEMVKKGKELVNRTKVLGPRTKVLEQMYKRLRPGIIELSFLELSDFSSLGKDCFYQFFR